MSDRVVKPAAGAAFDLYIFSMYEKPGWHPRTSGDRLHVAHPGSAIDYQNAVYELIEVGPGTGTPYAYRYAFRRWDDKLVVRQIFPYTQETARATASAVVAQRRQYQQHAWLVRLFPLTGLLPSAMLRRWEREWGLPMRRASIGSTILFGLITVNLAVYFSQVREEPSRWTPVFLFLALEQMIRFFWLLGSQEAVGSLVITLLWGFWNVIRGLDPDGMPRRRKSVEDFLATRDEVRHLKEQPWDIEVHSLFRDPVLLGSAPVLVEGEVYEPLGCDQQGHGIHRRYVFRLKKLDGVKDARREYSPERTSGQVTVLAAYEHARDRVHRWALLCGYLPASRQLELERKYDYNATSGTERSALALLLAAGLQLATLLFGRQFGAGHILALALTGESLYRLALARSRGEPIGSALGWLLHPLLRSL